MPIGAKSLGTLAVMIGADTSGLDKGIGNATTKVTMFGKTSTASMQMVGAAALGMGTAILAGLGAVGLASAKIGARFERTVVNAVTVAGGGMRAFEKEARRIGAASEKTATEAAEAMYILASAGLGVQGTIQATGVVTDFAIAKLTDMNTASAILTATVRGLGLEMTEGRHAMDVWAKATNISALNVERIRESMKRSVPVARALGWSIEELAAASGVLSDLQLEGSEVGTFLRMSMNFLAKAQDKTTDALARYGVTFSEVDPQLHNFGEIIQRLADTDMKRMSDAIDIFGSRAAPAMMALILNAREGKFAFEEYRAELENVTGTTNRMRKMMEDTVEGQFKRFMSAIQEIGLSINDLFREPLKKLLGDLADLATEIGNFIKSHQSLIITLGIVATAIGVVLAGLGAFLLLAPMIVAAFIAINASAIPITGTMLAIAAAIVFVGALIAAFAIVWKTNMGNIQEWTFALTNSINFAFSKVGIGMAAGLSAALTATRAFIGKMRDAFSLLGSAIKDYLSGNFEAASSNMKAAWAAASGSIKAAAAAVEPIMIEYDKVLTDLTDDHEHMQDVLANVVGSGATWAQMLDILKTKAKETGKSMQELLDELGLKLPEETGGGGEEAIKRQRENAEKLLAEIKSYNDEFLSAEEQKYTEALEKLNNYHEDAVISEQEYQEALAELQQFRKEAFLEDIEELNQTQFEKEQEKLDTLAEIAQIHREEKILTEEEYSKALAEIEHRRTMNTTRALFNSYDSYNKFFSNLGDLTAKWGDKHVANTLKIAGAYISATAKMFTFFGQAENRKMLMLVPSETALGLAALARYDFVGAGLHFSSAAAGVAGASEILGIIAGLPHAERGAVIMAHANEAVVPFERMEEAFEMWRGAGGGGGETREATLAVPGEGIILSPYEFTRDHIVPAIQEMIGDDVTIRVTELEEK